MFEYSVGLRHVAITHCSAQEGLLTWKDWSDTGIARKIDLFYNNFTVLVDARLTASGKIWKMLNCWAEHY
eukprot:5418900-Amphidinium_carterae.1